MTRHNLLTKLSWWAGAAAILIVVAYAGYFFEAWTGFPKGSDVYARITRVKFILDFFPHVNWQYHWANGLPTFSTEGPFFYYLAAILVKLTGITIEFSMIVMGFLTYSLLGLGVYGYVQTLTKRVMPALLSAVLVITSFGTWSWMVQGGIYPRILAVGLLAVCLWLLACLLKKQEENRSFRVIFGLLIFFLSALLLTHIMIGLFAFIAIFFHLLFLNKLRLGIRIFGGSLALSAVIYLPLFLNFSGSSGHFIGVISPVVPLGVSALWSNENLGWLILPVLVVSALLSLAWLKKAEQRRAMLAPSVLMMAIFTFYAFIGYSGLPGKYYYINGFIPGSAGLFLGLFGSLTAGILLGILLNYLQGKKRLLIYLLIFLALIGAVVSVPLGVEMQKNFYTKFAHLFVYDSSSPRSAVRATQEMGDLPKQEFQYRFAPFDALEAVWFNAVYQTPQERDYYGQGILHIDWRYWFEQALWNVEFSAEETKMALDWFAVKWFSESVANLGPIRPVEDVLKESPSRYMDNPLYYFTGQHAFIDWAVLLRFENLNPAPILSATNASPLLFIGNEAGYNMFFRQLALSNLNSQKLIPLLGKQSIDDYQPAELASFKTIILYNYKYHQKERAYKLLADYVRGGGNLIWELSGSPDAQGDLPEPAPFTRVTQTEIQTNWDYIAAAQPLSEGVNFSAFSPLIFEGGPWKLSLASSADLRSDSRGLLGKDGHFVAAVEEYGQGKVFLTTFNFLYHANTDKNLEEAKFLASILNWMGSSQPTAQVGYKTAFINPEERLIEVEGPAKGVLFKENFYPKWHAFLNGDKRQIFYAGPGMMYVQLPEGVSYPAQLKFEYKLSPVDLLAVVISVVSAALLLYYLMKGKIPLRLPGGKVLGSWWDKEEDG